MLLNGAGHAVPNITATKDDNTAASVRKLPGDSITYGGSSSGIILANTGAGAFTVTGTGTTAGSGGTLENIVGADAITLNTTGGLVTLRNMIIEDISGVNDATATNGTDRSGVDASLRAERERRPGSRPHHDPAHQRQRYLGGTNGVPDLFTVWNGLTITNSTIEATNRFTSPPAASVPTIPRARTR